MTELAAPAGDRAPADLAVLAEALREVSGADDAILGGLLLARADGLLLAAETQNVQIDTVAAMAAVMAGIAGQLIERAGVGESKACLFEGSSGHVVVFPMKDDMVLAVFSKEQVTTGMFSLAARSVLARLRKALARKAAPVDDEPAVPAEVDRELETPAESVEPVP